MSRQTKQYLVGPSDSPTATIVHICKKVFASYLSSTHHRYSGIWPKEHEVGTVCTTAHCIISSTKASTNNDSDFRYLQKKLYDSYCVCSSQLIRLFLISHNKVFCHLKKSWQNMNFQDICLRQESIQGNMTRII